ncbi:MAG: HEAT repeat domain-containing protein, partial [Armatimonadota bacterium]|nr:HEAT repeat domain-containing protein [Armatimonadota bacterium]
EATLVRAMQGVFRGRFGAFAHHPDPRAFSALTRSLTEGEPIMRVRAALALGWLRDTRAGPMLTRALADPAPAVRAAAGRALTQMGEGDLAHAVLAAFQGNLDPLALRRDMRALEPLLRAVEERHPSLCQPAVYALALLADLRTLPPLVNLLADSDPPLRDAARRALAVWGGNQPGAAEELVRALDGGESALRTAAAVALAYRGDGRALRPLLRVLLRTRDPAQAVAAEALTRLGSDGVEALIAQRTHHAARVREAVATALGHSGATRAGPAVMDLLDDELPAVRLAAIQAMQALGPAAAPFLPALVRRFQGDTDPHTRQALQQAIAAIGASARYGPDELMAAEPPAGSGTEPEATTARASQAAAPPRACWLRRWRRSP